jgi:hypothetical protein
MIEGSGSGSRSMPLTNEAQKHTDPTDPDPIRNTEFNTRHYRLTAPRAAAGGLLGEHIP